LSIGYKCLVKIWKGWSEVASSSINYCYLAVNRKCFNRTIELVVKYYKLLMVLLHVVIIVEFVYDSNVVLCVGVVGLM
jgi:hypothetical protein